MEQRYVRAIIALVAFFASAVPAYAGTADFIRGKGIVEHGTPQGGTACISCHGLTGAGNADAGYPRLAGLNIAYLMAQLSGFKNGTRQNKVMQAVATRLSEEDIASVGAWYAQQTPKKLAVRASEPNSKLLVLGMRLAIQGDWKRNVPACFDCHGPNGNGVAPSFPRLAGQYENYLHAQLEAWRKGKRRNDPQHLMQTVAENLSEQDMTAVARYLATLNAPISKNDTDQVSGNIGVINGRDRNSVQNESAEKNRQAEENPVIADYHNTLFIAPKTATIPAGEFGDMVRLGRNIFVHTQDYAKAYVGNSLNCVNCHLDEGRKADSAPLWGAYVLYPAYRKKNHKVNTLQERLQGCFRFSENGTAPPADSKELTALVTYSYWMARGAPTGITMKGRGYPKLKLPQREPDVERGKLIYATHCALCHSAEGQGTKVGKIYVFPPLWGPASFNDGAGMHKTVTAAGFIKANMPFGRGSSLSDQEAWDVAAFMNSHSRPATKNADK